MIWYFVFPVFLYFIVICGYRKQWVGVFVILLLVFFSMFRGEEVGTDTASYMEGMDKVAEVFLSKDSFFDDNGRYEYLYYLLTVVIWLFDLSPRLMLFFFSFVSIYFVFLGAHRLKLNIALVALFYVLTNMYLFSFNVARQFAAIGLMFYGVSFLVETSWKKYLFFLWVFIGGMIHNSVLLCAPLFLCSVYDFNRTRIIKLFYAFFLLAAIIPFYKVAFMLLSLFGAGGYVEKYALDGDFGASDDFSILNIIYKFILATLCYYIFRLRNDDTDARTDLFDNLFLVFILMNSLLAYGNLATFRFKFNFEIFSCIFMAIYFAQANNIKRPEFFIYTGMKLILLFKVSLDYSPYYLQF